MPSHYPHWSYGKAFEKLKTLYDYGVSGLPYEMVINSNPALAYLMRDNSLLPADPHHRARLRPQRLLQEQLHLQVDPRRVHDRHLQGARRARAPLHRGPEHRRRQGREHPRRRARAVAAVPAQPRGQEALAETRSASSCSTPRSPAHDPFQSIHRRADYVEPDLQQGAARRPTRTCCSSSATTIPYLAELGARPAHDRPRGGAVLHPADRDQDHERGLGLVLCTSASSNALELPQELHLEFLVRHNQVRAPDPGRPEPVPPRASSIWEDIERRCDEPTPEEREHVPPGKTGREAALRDARGRPRRRPSCAAGSPRS